MFPRGYPIPDPERLNLLPTPERVGASVDYTGRGVTIAFIDSGFYPHQDLGNRVRVHADATDSNIIEGRRFEHPRWYSWHGEMTSVIAAGDGSASNGLYRSIAPDAQLVLIKVSTARKQIREPDIARGMQWLLDNHHRFNVRVVNISVGGDYPNHDPDYRLHKLVRDLTDAGITAVVAAGNAPSSPLVPPCTAPEALVVGGYDDHNSIRRAEWTLYTNTSGFAYDGTPKPDLLAPANWIVSPILPGTFVEREAYWLAQMFELSEADEDKLRDMLKEALRDLVITPEEAATINEFVKGKIVKRIKKHKIADARHQYVGGTSVAAPIVSSVIAQMLQANPGLTPSMIKAILMQTAKPLPNAPLLSQGAGVLNAAAAVAAALALITTSPKSS